MSRIHTESPCAKNKKTPRLRRLFVDATELCQFGQSLCPGEDLNLHALAGLSTSRINVYQFQHPGIYKRSPTIRNAFCIFNIFLVVCKIRLEKLGDPLMSEKQPR